MDELTTKKANIILGKMSKIELCKFLNISRSGLYNKLLNNKWKEYQIDRIDYAYNKIINSKNIKKVCIEDKKLCIYSVENPPIIKLIYPL